MIETIKYYTYTDEDNEEHKIQHITRTCGCGGNCEKDELNYFDEWTDRPFSLDLEGHECKWMIEDLLQIGIDCGRIKEKE